MSLGGFFTGLDELILSGYRAAGGAYQYVTGRSASDLSSFFYKATVVSGSLHAILDFEQSRQVNFSQMTNFATCFGSVSMLNNPNRKESYECLGNLFKYTSPVMHIGIVVLSQGAVLGLNRAFSGYFSSSQAELKAGVAQFFNALSMLCYMSAIYIDRNDFGGPPKKRYRERVKRALTNVSGKFGNWLPSPIPQARAYFSIPQA